MNQWSLLIISMVSALLSGIFRKIYAGKYAVSEASRHGFNILSAIFTAICLILINKGYSASQFTFVLGMIFGVITALQQIFMLKALESGPWSYTSVIVSFSTIIPSLSGVILFGEKLDVIQIVGMFLMGVCIFLSTDFSDSKKDKSIKWMIYCLITFFTTGLIGLMQKVHQSTSYKNELGGFLITAFFISAVYSSFGMFKNLEKGKKPENIKSIFTLSASVIMATCGICAAINNQLNLFLTGIMDSAVFFPIVNGGGLVLTVISSIILFKEKLSIRQWIGIFTGILSVVFLCNPFR